MSLPHGFLEGKVAIVTGASSGIGRQVAERLATSGVNLVIAARQAPPLQQVCDEIVAQTGVKVLVVAADVGRQADIERLVQQTLHEFGRIDILVNNAGVEAFAPFELLSLEEIQSTVQINLTSAIIASRLVAPVMRQQGWGHIINMASTAGKYGPPYAALYAATKAGLIALSQSLRLEFRSVGVRATAICPGFTQNGGIYDRIRSSLNREAPRIFGGTTADAVARSVIRAIRNDCPEIIVNRPPYRMFFAINALLPRLGEYLFRKFGASFFRRIGELRRINSKAPVTSKRDAA